MRLWRPTIASPWCAASRIASSQLHRIIPQSSTSQAPSVGELPSPWSRTWARIPFLAKSVGKSKGRSGLSCHAQEWILNLSFHHAHPAHPAPKRFLFLIPSSLFHLLPKRATACAGLYLEKHLLLTWISRRLRAECQCPPDLGLHLSERHVDQIAATAPPPSLLARARTTLESTPWLKLKVVLNPQNMYPPSLPHAHALSSPLYPTS